MFERRLALRYIKSQKRHSFFTISCIAVALALMTLLFIGYSTYKNIIRDSAYIDKPYHIKFMKLTEDEYLQLEGNSELQCKRVDEADGTISAQVQINTYHEDMGLYINTLFPDKYLYSDRFEEYKTDQIDVNTALIECDRLDLTGRYNAISNLGVYFMFILLLVFALRMMIDTAFEVSSKERERQFGMLQCIGAAPKQIIRIIVFEGLFLCMIGIPIGVLLGIGLSYAAFGIVKTSGVAEAFFTPEKAESIMHIHMHPLLILLGVLTGALWVFMSAYQTGTRITKKSPIQAINGRNNKPVKVRSFSLFGYLFGWQGKLASRNNRRQKKRFIITVVSLTMSIALFASFTIVLAKSLEFFERTVDYLGLHYDMGIALKVDTNNQLSYKEGLDTIRDSGYFEIKDFSKTQMGYFSDGDGNNYPCSIIYFPREIYDEQFEGGAPISYDELTEKNAVILLDQTNEESVGTEIYDSPMTMDVAVEEREVVTDEMLAGMSDDEKEKVVEYITEDFKTGEKSLRYRYKAKYTSTTLTVAGSAPKRKADENNQDLKGGNNSLNAAIFVSTLDTFENGAYQLAEKGSLINQDGVEYLYVDMKDTNDYENIKTFLNSDPDKFTIDEDYYGDTQKMRTSVGALKIGMAFICILIAIIAIVNMVNILTTGILNRNSELAAMQCIGMTDSQLSAMTIIECLQYALLSGVLATLIMEGLMFAMKFLLKYVELDDIYGDLLSFTEPLPRIWLSAAVAFAAAVIASFVPLNILKKTSLIDRIRTID